MARSLQQPARGCPTTVALLLHVCCVHYIAVPRCCLAMGTDRAEARADHTEARSGGDACSGPLDCQLNGVCNATGLCECGPAWTGGNCSRLNLLPATKGAGFYTLNSSWSSWGNMIVRDPQSGKYYMAADEMANHCGLGTWGQNSRCVIAEADVVTGPYQRVSVVIDPWCHGTWMDRDPVSGRWIFGHMGSGKPKGRSGAQCKNCSSGVTPPGAHFASCPRESAVSTNVVSGALISASPLGPWNSAGPHLINGPNCVPFFMPNGTLFFACPYMAKVNDSSCNNQNAGMTLTRAESLEHALAGNYSYRYKKPTMWLGGTNASNPCANWEGNMVWVDSFGFFHSLAHAFRGQPTQYPLPGCHFAPSKSAPRSDNTCTANGGHAYSVDGENWYISPVPPFTSTIKYTDGSQITFRARERAHLVFNDKKDLLYLGNGVGSPGHGQNVGVPGADHTFVQLQPLNH